ncbi:MAG: SLC13 family permease [Bacteroidia bacterium]
MKKRLALVAGPLAACILWLCELDPQNPLVSAMAGITVWMAIWWLTEVVHLAITSFLPLILLPLFGIADAQQVANQYMDQVIFLFIGGFLIAFAIERHGLHQRIALFILGLVGKSPARILLGVMLTAWLLSMWISNTATVMMLLSAVTAVVMQLDKQIEDAVQRQQTAAALCIGLAYAATIGGMATLVGTPPNMVFYKMYTAAYPQQHDMDFGVWFSIGFPLSIVFLFISWWVIKRLLLQHSGHIRFETRLFTNMRKEMGPIRRDESVVIAVFVSTVVLWFTRSGFDVGHVKIPGWSHLFGKHANMITDSTVAIAMAFILFFIPSHSEKGKALLGWHEAEKLPFDIILLFGSGFALALGFELSGLSGWLAGHLALLHAAPLWLVVLLVALVVTFISEFASNVASIQLALPILISLQKVLDVHPLLLMVPATLAASLGFMLPVATAPNTIVFGTGRIKMKEMAKTGIVLDVVGVLLILAITLLWGRGM